MNDFFSELMSLVGPWTIVFCLLIAIVTSAIRRVVGRLWLGAALNWWWNEFAMHLLPLLLGGTTAALVKSIPYPAGVSSTASRVIFGIVAGAFSGFVYFLVKKIANKKLTEAGIDVQIPDEVGPTDPSAGKAPELKP